MGLGDRQGTWGAEPCPIPDQQNPGLMQGAASGKAVERALLLSQDERL